MLLAMRLTMHLMIRWPRAGRTVLALLLSTLVVFQAHVQAQAQPSPQALPVELEAALARAKLPREALGVWISEAATATAPARLAHRAQVQLNPASLMKLVTTTVALDQLGPAFEWKTPVYLDGVVRDGVLHGNLYLRGQGDPKLVVEKLWLLLRRVQGFGVRKIVGDIVLDQSAFELVTLDPAAFDGEAMRPYNAAPQALLLNFKALVLTFVPDAKSQTATIHMEPPMAGVELQPTVALAGAGCEDWRSALKADFSDPQRLRFAGTYAASCGERVWPLAYADPRSYAARAVAGTWASLGGQLSGQVREGRVPAGLKPAFEFGGTGLVEAVRDLNKFSNNVMAQQVFLTLSLRQRGVGSLEGSRELVRAWWRENLRDNVRDNVRDGVADQAVPVLDNGSGLSRSERISAQALGRLLQLVWAAPWMPELASSLPMSGVDGTLRRSRAESLGAAHLKTGTLRDVAGVAGFVDGASGKRYVLVAIVNHAAAANARPVFDALIDWTVRDQKRQ